MAATEYEIEAVLDEGRVTRVVRARRRRDGLPVVLKQLRLDAAALAGRIAREYALLRRISAPEVVQALALDEWQGLPVLVLAAVPGTPLGAWIRRPRSVTDILERLQLALGLARAVALVHAAGVLHRDIKPSNVLVTPDSRVVLIDFSAATLAAEPGTLDADGTLGEGTLQYMAPEQTGRTGRTVDARSDHYALGVTLFELFTGRLPFLDDDPLGLVHSHLARVPPDPRGLCPELPLALARVILKLLEKAPDARYQSVHGLRADLQRCHDELRRHGRVDPFQPGLSDISPQLRLPEALPGRERERERLHAALARAQAGEPALALVTGPAGAGKSALIRGLSPAAAAAGATLGAGKFEQVEHGIPYAALAAALEQIVRRRLAEPEASLLVWRARLAAALQPAARLVCDLVPALGALLGPQPPVPDMPPAESAQRFHALMLRLVRTLATPGRPLVLVLEDLHWADPATLDVVQRLLASNEVPHLLIVASARDEALADGHPVQRLSAALHAARVPVDHVPLRPLGPAVTAAFIAAALSWSLEQVDELARLVHERTAGNPLFIRALLRALHEQGLLRFDADAGAWRCDAAQAAFAGQGDDLDALLARKLADLSPAARAALELAACFGSRFSDRRLAAVLEDSFEDVARALAEARARGLVQPVGGEDLAESGAAEVVLEFAHDRIQQAAYALADAPRRRALHLRIARSMLQQGPPDGDAVFAVAAHMNLAAPLLTAPDERLRLAELDLLATRRAKQASAYAAAAQYARHGIAALPGDPWTEHYPLCFALHCERMECEHVSGDIDGALARFAPLLRGARDDLDRAEVHDRMVRLEITRERFAEAARVGRAGLRLLGVDLAEQPTRATALKDLAAIRWLRGLRPPAALAALPAATDPKIRLALRLLARISVATYYVGELALAQVALRAVALAIRHGVTGDAAIGFAIFAAITLNRLDDPDAARDLVAVAYALSDRFPGLALQVKMANFGGVFVQTWVQPFAAAAPRIEPFIDHAIALGDYTFAIFALGGRIYLHWLGDGALADVQRSAASVHTVARRLPGYDHKHWFIPIERACLALRGRTEALHSMSDGEWDERPLTDRLGPEHAAPTFFYAVFKAVLLCHAGRFRDAEDLAHRHHRVRMEGHPLLAESVLLRLLARAAQAPERPLGPADRPHLQRWLRRLQLWARACPENFGARALLGEAELARAEGQHADATLLYQRAVEAARASGQRRIEALALERAARHLLARESPVLADMYLRAARDAYQRWGADGVVAALDREFPSLAPRAPAPAPAPAPARETTTSNPGALDVEALLRASQAISGEIELERLLRTLVRILLEIAGARRCAVLLAREDGELRVEALADLDGVTVLQAQPLAESPLPAAIVHLVARARRDVILDDARAGEFAGDPAVAGLRSVLCAPIVHQGALVGVLYLDNELAPDTFTAARSALLRQLAGQVAISVENARLYRGLARARDAAVAADRTKTRFLMNMSHELRTPLNGVLGYTDLIAESAADGDLSTLDADLGKIRRAAIRLLNTLGNILELSRLEAGDLRPTPAALDLPALLRELVADAAPLAAEHGDALALTLAPDLPAVRSDRVMLTHALRSLLDNAIRFTAGGEVDVDARGYMSQETAWVAVRVRDTGIGIAPADLPRLFTSFGQLDDAPTRSFEGTGVSLALTRRYCELIGARVDVDSAPGRGSSFTLHLPARA